MIAAVPVIETQQKIKDIEYFIISSLFLVLFIIFIKNNIFAGYLFYKILFVLFGGVLGFIALKYWAFIWLSIFEGMLKSVDKYQEFVMRYKRYLVIFLGVLSACFALEGVHVLFGWEWEYILGSLFMGLIIAGIISFIRYCWSEYEKKKR